MLSRLRHVCFTRGLQFFTCFLRCFHSMMPATEPLQVGVVVVVSVLNVVTVCTLGNASCAVVHGGFALSACSGFNNFPALCPVAGQAFTSVRGCPRHARRLPILGTYTLFLLPEVAGAGALSNTPPYMGNRPTACLFGGGWCLGFGCASPSDLSAYYHVAAGSCVARVCVSSM